MCSGAQIGRNGTVDGAKRKQGDGTSPTWSLGGSAHLRQYRYVAVINFNRAPDRQRPYRGFGIFLHVKKNRGTAGCIGITKKRMELVLRYLRPGDTITISR